MGALSRKNKTESNCAAHDITIQWYRVFVLLILLINLSSSSLLSPYLEELTKFLPAPPKIEATRDLTSQSLPSTPLIITGLVSSSFDLESVPASIEAALLALEEDDEVQKEETMIPVDIVPFEGHSEYNKDQFLEEMPIKPSPGIIRSPGKKNFSPSLVLPLIQIGRTNRRFESSQQRTKSSAQMEGKEEQRTKKRITTTAFYAYVRTWNLLLHHKKLLQSKTLPLNKILHTLNNNNNNNNKGEGSKNLIKSINLWIGDGEVASALHYDGLDNILLQLCGTKLLLLLPPSVVDDLGYETREEEEWMYVLDNNHVGGEGNRKNNSKVGRGTATEDSLEKNAASSSSMGVYWDVRKTGRFIENHASFHPFRHNRRGYDDDNHGKEYNVNKQTTEQKKDLKVIAERWASHGAKLVTLEPGQALFLPALWSHTVVSNVEERVGGEIVLDNNANTTTNNINNKDYGINIAVNIWFSRPERPTSHLDGLSSSEPHGNPNWAEGYYILGNDLSERRDEDDIKMMIDGNSADGDGREGRVMKANVAAVESYRRALEIRPDFFDAAHNLASALLNLESDGNKNMIESAVAQYDTAMAISRNSSEKSRCLCNSGIALKKVGRFDEAMLRYKTAVFVDPMSGRARYLLGNLLAVMPGMLVEAEVHLREAVRLAMSTVGVNNDANTLTPDANLIALSYNSLGVVFEELGRAEKARENYQAAIVAKPGYRIALENLERLDQRKGMISTTNLSLKS